MQTKTIIICCNTMIPMVTDIPKDKETQPMKPEDIEKGKKKGRLFGDPIIKIE